MSSACVKHPMTIGENVCAGCGHTFCRECIVFPFGTDRPGLCIGCALERGGVRASGSRMPRLPRRAIRERLRASDRARDNDVSSPRDPAEVPGSDQVEPVTSWLGDDDSIDGIPGAWSETYR